MARRRTDRLSIAVVPAWYPTRDRPGDGVFVRDHALAAARDSDVAVIADDGPSASVRGLFRLTDAVEDGVRTFRVAYRRPRRLPQLTAAGYLLGIAAALWRLRREGRPADLLHAHVHRAAWAATLVATPLRRPVVITEHSSEFGFSGISEPALRRARIAFRRAALVCPVSLYLQRQIEAHGVRARFRVVPNAVDMGTFTPGAPAPGPPHLVTIAALHPKKGLGHLLDALAAPGLRDRELVLDLVGSGPERAAYEARAAALGIADRVVFHGFLPKAEVVRLLRAGTCLVLPSLTENLPVSIIEAMACGLPVVASAVGGIPEMVDDRSGRLVPPADGAALAAAIAATLDDAAAFDRGRIAAIARERWSLEVVGATWTAVYRDVLSRA